MDWILAFLEGIRFYFALVPKGWWKKFPFLPLPSTKYVKFRLHTAYGMTENGWERPGFIDQILDIKRFLLWRRKLRIRMGS